MMEFFGKSDFIVIVAPCPSSAPAQEGWMSRIHMVDKIFAKTKRIYLDPISGGERAGPPKRKLHSRLISEYRIDMMDPHHRGFVEKLILDCNLVYIHTCHLARHFLSYYPTGKIITDIHGIVPEEERLLGRPEHAIFYEGVERVVLKNSNKIVVVTDAMKRHLLEKHPDCNAEFFVMPIIEEQSKNLSARKKRTPTKKYSALYSGGIQAWQNINATLELCDKTSDFCDFKFLSHEHEKIKHMSAGMSFVDSSVFGVSKKRDLAKHYLNADFGFVLRDDIAVNRVSCPTKLSEYLWFGVIPIVRSSAIGDFETKGYCYITEEEFLAGLIPDDSELEIMRNKNWDVINELAGRFDSIRSKLETLKLKNSVHGNTLFGLPIGDRCIIFPGFSELYLFSDEMKHFVKPIIGTYNEITFDLVGEKARTIRFLPYVGKVVFRVNSIKVVGKSVNAEKISVTQFFALGSVKDGWMSVEKSAPYFELSFSSEIVITSVSLCIEFEDQKKSKSLGASTKITMTMNGKSSSTFENVNSKSS